MTKPFRFEELLSHGWGYDYDPGSNVIEVYVGYLRKKLGAGAIETVRGNGLPCSHVIRPAKCAFIKMNAR